MVPSNKHLYTMIIVRRHEYLSLFNLCAGQPVAVIDNNNNNNDNKLL